MNKFALKLSYLIGAALCIPALSFAQQAGEEKRTLEEVIVTAQKISEKLQNVPISISVATAQDLKNINAFDFKDIEEITPGITFGGGAGLQSAAISIRGVGPDFFALGTPPNVAVFVDQVAQAQIGSVFSTMVDVERIELLRGPQGTLYGRNAPGGAFNITTESPDHEGFSGFIEGTYSQFDSSDFAGTQLRAAVNIPLIDGKLAWRLAAVVDESDGFVRMANPVASQDTTGGNDNRAIRSKLLWTPSDTLSLMWTVNYQDLEQNPAGFNFHGLVPGTGGTALSPVPAIINRFEDNRNFGVAPSVVTGDLKDTSLHLTWETASFNLDVIGFYQEYDTFSDEVRDPFFNARGFFQIVPDSEITTFEVRFSDSNDTLDYVAGIYYFDTTFEGFNDILTQGVAVNGILGSATKGYAGFGNVNFHLSPKWDLALGLRYDDVEDKIDTSTTFSGINASLQDELNFDDVSWSFKLRHYFNDDLTAYLAIDKAFKQGGFNGLVAGVQALNDTFGLAVPPTVAAAAADTISYGAESSEAIEFGIKGTFLEKRLSASAAIFYQRYDDHQVAQTNNQPQALGPIFGSFFLASITNAEEVVTKGIELDVAYLLTEHWDVAVRAAYSDPEVEEWSSRFCPSGENTAPDQLYCPLGNGDSLNALPNWDINLQLGFENELSAGWGLYSRATMSFEDEPSRINVTDQFADSKYRFGMTVGVKNTDMGLDIRAWAKNIGDEDGNVNPGTRRNGDPALPTAFQGSFSEGREYGVTVRYDF